jgi:hypothetical protein
MTRENNYEYELSREEYAKQNPAPAEVHLGQRIGRIALRQLIDWLWACQYQWEAEKRCAWTRHAMSRDKFCQPINPNHWKARKWCAIGRLDLLSTAGKFNPGLRSADIDRIIELNDDAKTPYDAMWGIRNLVERQAI